MHKFLVAMVLICCLFSGCSQNRTESSPSQELGKEEISSSLSDGATQAESSPSDTSSDAEITQLFCDAMTQINHLATEDPSDNLKQIFDDVKILDGVVTIEQVPYMETSLPYEELAGYYGEIFTDDALDWVLSAKYANVDGMVYCSATGGQSGGGFTFVSVENLQENTYQGTYLTSFSDEEQHTAFSVKKTDAGYRISSIDYRPASLH